MRLQRYTKVSQTSSLDPPIMQGFETMQLKLSALVVALGVILAAGKIYADSEPGAVPLLIILIGAIWQAVARVRRHREAL